MDPSGHEPPLGAQAPVLDTSDLAALAARELLVFPEDLDEEMADTLFDGGDPGRFGELQDLERYVKWNNGARRLAAAGVRPGPSHYRWRDDPRMFPTVWGAYFDSEELAAQRNAMLGHPEGFPLVLYGFALPHGFDPALEDLPVRLPLGWGWAAVAHQSAGVLCHQPRFVGFVLQIRPELHDAVRCVANFVDPDDPEHDCIAAGGSNAQRLSMLHAYHELLRGLDLSCEWSYAELEEGLYPLDASCAAQLSEMVVPTTEEFRVARREGAPEPDDFDGWWAELGLDLRSLRPAIYVLGENCD